MKELIICLLLPLQTPQICKHARWINIIWNETKDIIAMYAFHPWIKHVRTSI